MCIIIYVVAAGTFYRFHLTTKRFRSLSLCLISEIWTFAVERFFPCDTLGNCITVTNVPYRCHVISKFSIHGRKLNEREQSCFRHTIRWSTRVMFNRRQVTTKSPATDGSPHKRQCPKKVASLRLQIQHLILLVHNHSSLFLFLQILALH